MGRAPYLPLPGETVKGSVFKVGQRYLLFMVMDHMVLCKEQDVKM